MGKLLSFPRRHPALSVIGVAGAGLLAGPELALGVMLGAGVAALVNRRSAGRMESRLEHVEKEAVDTARSVRQRAREIFGTEIVKQRARAVVQAARGQIAPVPTDQAEAQGGQTSQVPPSGESQRQPASETSGPSPM